VVGKARSEGKQKKAKQRQHARALHIGHLRVVSLAFDSMLPHAQLATDFQKGDKVTLTKRPALGCKKGVKNSGKWLR
jgi:hypothetical protein